MGRMGAIDHVIRWSVGRFGINLFDGFPQRLPRWEPAVSLNCERDCDRDAGLLGRPRDPDRLAAVGHGDPCDHFDPGFPQGMNLVSVISLCLSCAHNLAGIVAIAPRSDTTADHNGRGRGLVRFAQFHVQFLLLWYPLYAQEQDMRTASTPVHAAWWRLRRRKRGDGSSPTSL
jgi:hypothetical protein